MLRDVKRDDWPAILRLANASVRHVPGAGPQHEWHENRRHFDTTTRSQTQYVFDEDGTVIGYGAVESDARGELRMFVVTTSDRLSSVGDALCRRAIEVARSLAASRVWFTEYVSDGPLLEFARDRGFVEVARGTLPDGPEVVTLCRDLSAGKPPRGER